MTVDESVSMESEKSVFKFIHKFLFSASENIYNTNLVKFIELLQNEYFNLNYQILYLHLSVSISIPRNINYEDCVACN